MVINEIMKLSYDIVSEYYNNNLKPFFEYTDEDVLWIGPANKQLLQSKKAIIKAWSKETSDLTFTMGNVTEYSVPLKSKCCCVILLFSIYTHYPDGMTQMHHQRIDLTWIERKVSCENGETVTAPKMAKIHISNGCDLDEQDFIYAIHSKDINTNQTVITPGKRILFKTKDGQICSYLSDSILWIEKFNHGKNSVIHTVTEDVQSTKNTDYFMEKYPDMFLRPHKSYLVNPSHIKNICRFNLTLDNGTTLSIPEKKYTKFKAEYAKWTAELNNR